MILIGINIIQYYISFECYKVSTISTIYFQTIADGSKCETRIMGTFDMFIAKQLIRNITTPFAVSHITWIFLNKSNEIMSATLTLAHHHISVEVW